METSQFYVYGVMRTSDAPDLGFKAVSAPDAAPAAVTTGALQTIVSPIDLDEVMPSRRNLLAHAKALETLMASGPVLPMRFGLVAATLDAVRKTATTNAALLAERLTALEGCAEYGVSVSWKRDAMMRAVVARRPDIQRAYQALAGRSEAATHFDRVELGRQVEAEIDALRAQAAEQCRAAVAAVARHVEMREPEDDVGIAKLDCLLETSRAGALAAVLETFEAGREDALEIKLVGPAPAYSFVDLALRWADDAEAA